MHNGFVIGAAVGAGFGAIESVQYAFSSAQTVNYYSVDEGETIAVVETAVNSSLIDNQLLRMLTAIGGHSLYCAPYSAEIARNSPNGKIGLKSFFNFGFISAFLISSLFHGLWDLASSTYLSMIIRLVILIILILMQGLRILRKSLNQAVQIGSSASGGAALEHGAGVGYTRTMLSYTGREKGESPKPGPAAQAQMAQQPAAVSQAAPKPVAASARVECSKGELMGQQWSLEGKTSLSIGRDPACDIRFSASAQGVSGRHCNIQLTQFGWTVKDLGSTYGTFVSGNQKVLPGTEVKLKNGNVISLGSNENSLVIFLP